jgi:hypothetical protein
MLKDFEKSLNSVINNIESLRHIEEKEDWHKIISEKQYNLAKHELRDLLIEVAEMGINGDIENLKEVLFILKRVE